jgi:hypothetical protein
VEAVSATSGLEGEEGCPFSIHAGKALALGATGADRYGCSGFLHRTCCQFNLWIENIEKI